MGAGLFADVPRGGWVLGLGILVVLLGVTAVSPVISRPFLAAAQATYRRVVRHRRQPRRPELPAQPAAYDRDRVGADDRPRPRLHHGDPRRLREGQRRPGGRGELRRRLHRQQRVRRAVLARASPTRWPRSTASTGWSGSAGARPSATATSSASPGSTRPTRRSSGSEMVQRHARRLHRRHGARRRGAGPRTKDLSVGDTYTLEKTPKGRARAAGRRHLRREPGDLLPDRHHAADPQGPGLPGRRQRADPRRRSGHRRPAEPARRGRRGPADRHRQGPGRVRRRAAGADRPAGADDLRAARAGPGHRRARHRQHPRAVGDRADP